MPSFFTPVLPSYAGLALGSPSMPWTLYSSSTIPVYGNTVNSIPFSATPALDATSSMAVELILTADVTSSSFVTGVTAGAIQLVIFYIAQDSVGGHKFIWPATFHGFQQIDNVNLSMAANQVMMQMAYWSGSRGSALPACPAVFYP
jgi:hypothetical protein